MGLLAQPLEKLQNNILLNAQHRAEVGDKLNTALLGMK